MRFTTSFIVLVSLIVAVCCLMDWERRATGPQKCTNVANMIRFSNASFSQDFLRNVSSINSTNLFKCQAGSNPPCYGCVNYYSTTNRSFCAVSRTCEPAAVVSWTCNTGATGTPSPALATRGPAPCFAGATATPSASRPLPAPSCGPIEGWRISSQGFTVCQPNTYLTCGDGSVYF
eukprot:TRINITY_DN11336_c0_g1_i1.p1 TRINITY_DN11336_c0_g1~~TRINITY_DN11336_c0_g1_i1.p1  ORF type:complete len:176 (-),score=31.18 TRINITY_DN11336_c0_g1_i1:42-569(-)